jgi:hypothetical protein
MSIAITPFKWALDTYVGYPTQPTRYYVEETHPYEFSAQTGAGWLPFVFEKELVVDLSQYASPDIEIVDAQLYIRVDTGCWTANGIMIEINGKTVYDGDSRSFHGSIKEHIVVGINRIVVHLKPQTYAYFVQPARWCQGASLSGRLLVTVRHYYTVSPYATTEEREKIIEEILKLLREMYKTNLTNTYQLQGYQVTSVRETPTGVQITVQKPDGTQETKNFDIWGFFGQLSNIIIIVIILFVLIELVRAFRR